MMDDHPWFRFHASRWLGAPSIRRVGSAARGLLIDLMAIAHHGTPYGYVTSGGLSLNEQQIAHFLHERGNKTHNNVTKLVKNGVLKVSEEGTFYIPLMIKMSEEHQKHVEDGSKGGNPNLVSEVNPPVNPEVNPQVKAENSIQEKSTEEHIRKKTRPPQIGARPSIDKPEKKSVKSKNILDMNAVDMLQYFQNRHLIYGTDKQPKGKSAKLLKELIKDIGAERVHKMVSYLFDNWETFQSKYKIKSGSPTVGILCGFATSIEDDMAGRGAYDPSKRGSSAFVGDPLD